MIISPATTSAAIESAREKPVNSTTSPATAVAMNAYRSLRMCWKAPSTLRLVRLALLISQAAATLTAMPTMAVMKTSRPSTSGRIEQPADRLVDEPRREQQQGEPVGLRGQDLGAFEPVGPAAACRPGGQVDRPQREHDGRGVGEHVPGVGDQGQGSGDDADDDLGQP